MDEFSSELTNSLLHSEGKSKGNYRTAPTPFVWEGPVLSPSSTKPAISLRRISFIYKQQRDAFGNWVDPEPIKKLRRLLSIEPHNASRNWFLLNEYEAAQVTADLKMGFRSAASINIEGVTQRLVERVKVLDPNKDLEISMLQAKIRVSTGIPLDERIWEVAPAQLGDPGVKVYMDVNKLKPMSGRESTSVWINPMQGSVNAMDNDGDPVQLITIRNRQTGQTTVSHRMQPKSRMINAQTAGGMGAQVLMEADLARMETITGQRFIEQSQLSSIESGGLRKRGGSAFDDFVDRVQNPRTYIQKNILGMAGSVQAVQSPIQTNFSKLWNFGYYRAALELETQMQKDPAMARDFRANPRKQNVWLIMRTQEFIDQYGYEVLEKGNLSALDSFKLSLNNDVSHILALHAKRLGELNPDLAVKFVDEVLQRAEEGTLDIASVLQSKHLGTNITTQGFTRSYYKPPERVVRNIANYYLHENPLLEALRLPTQNRRGEKLPGLVEVSNLNVDPSSLPPALRKFFKAPALVGLRDDTGRFVGIGGGTGEGVTTVAGIPMGLVLDKTEGSRVYFQSAEEMVGAFLGTVNAEVEPGRRFRVAEGRFSLQRILSMGADSLEVRELAEASGLSAVETWHMLSKGIRPVTFLKQLVANYDTQRYGNRWSSIKKDLSNFLSSVGLDVGASVDAAGRLSTDKRNIEALSRQYVFDPLIWSNDPKALAEQLYLAETVLHDETGHLIIGPAANVLETKDGFRHIRGLWAEWVDHRGVVRRTSKRQAKQSRSATNVAISEDPVKMLILDMADQREAALFGDLTREHTYIGEGIGMLTEHGYNQVAGSATNMVGPVITSDVQSALTPHTLTHPDGSISFYGYKYSEGELLPKLRTPSGALNLEFGVVSNLEIATKSGGRVGAIMTLQGLMARQEAHPEVAATYAARTGIGYQEAQEQLIRAINAGPDEVRKYLSHMSETLSSNSAQLHHTQGHIVEMPMGFDLNINERQAAFTLSGEEAAKLPGYKSGAVSMPQMAEMSRALMPHFPNASQEDVLEALLAVSEGLTAEKFEEAAIQVIGSRKNPKVGQYENTVLRQLAEGTEKQMLNRGRLQGQLHGAIDEMIRRIIR